MLYKCFRQCWVILQFKFSFIIYYCNISEVCNNTPKIYNLISRIQALSFSFIMFVRATFGMRQQTGDRSVMSWSYLICGTLYDNAGINGPSVELCCMF